ncbi:hypothetical protein [Embleya sp. NPDC020630]|uniref:hypothetical protein n=1 Tax=Embleya sp. NPDC020630 TaxID=3363979 RepID=UPI0037BD240C
MITSIELIARSEAAGGALPLLSLDEFFVGNHAQDSLAPNQWEVDRPADARPELAEIHRRLRVLQEAPDVAWIRVQPHDDLVCRGGIMAEAVAVCTSASTREIERRVDHESLCADGAIEGLVYRVDRFTDLPDIPEGHRVVSLVWD